MYTLYDILNSQDHFGDDFMDTILEIIKKKLTKTIGKLYKESRSNEDAFKTQHMNRLELI